jgi:hypothetical protein
VSTTRWADVVQQLVVRMRATAGYRAPWASDAASETVVFHSVEVALQGEHTASRYLVVGYAGLTPEALRDGGRSGQRFDTMGSNRGRKETGTVTCLAVYQGGDGGEMQDGLADAALRAAQAIVGDVGDALRVPADGPTLGIAAPRLLIEMGDRMEFWPFLSEGIGWKVLFDVKYSTAI